MGSNPYRYGDDEDDDLFGEKTPSSSDTNDMQTFTGNSLNELVGQLPPEIEQVVRNVFAGREANRPLIPPPPLKITLDLMEIVDGLDIINPLGPAVRALGEQAEGEDLNTLTAFFACERYLLTSHFTIKMINETLGDLGEDTAASQALLNFIAQFLFDRIEHLAAQYRRLGTDLHRVPEESLITGGLYLPLLPFVRATMYGPGELTKGIVSDHEVTG